MMVGIIGTVVNIVGVDMPEVNKNNRRFFVEDEYDLYDVRKARPFWNDVCEVNGWDIVKDEEDFKEDYVCKINNELYFMELQVVGYWHNFDLSKISNVRISASKVKLLKEKGNGGLIFLNCVPNKFFAINVNQVTPEMKKDSVREQFYEIPLRTINPREVNVLDTNYCDCLENHLPIMRRSDGRMAFGQKDYNIRGANGICC